MAFPLPSPGLVIRYSYLWASEYAEGREEGLKDRPCAIVLVSRREAGDEIVTVLPVTHTPPVDPLLAVELPANTKQRLGLDDARSWVVLTEVNRFAWPGPDLRPARPGDASSIVYGALPYRLFEAIRLKFADVVKVRAAVTVKRTD